ncbi:MAG TPA: TIR domain-containing protein [Mycobacteriales bacterium]|nr:TIR domain-containing protein [Mycobacteriales bacterium]
MHHRAGEASDLSDRAPFRRYRLPGGIASSRWSPDGLLLAVYTCDGRLEVRWGDSLERSGPAIEGLPANDSAYLEWSPTSREFFVGARIGYVGVFSVRPDNLVFERQLRATVKHLSDVAWSPDGSVLVALVDEDELHVWDPGTGALLATERIRERFARLLWCGPGRLVVAGRGYPSLSSATPSLTFYRWTGYELIPDCTVTGPHGSAFVNGLALLESGEVVSIGDDGAAAIWEAATGRLVRRLEEASARRPLAVDASALGSLLVVQDEDADHVWSMASMSYLGSLPGRTRAGRRVAAGFRPGRAEFAGVDELGLAVWNLAGLARTVAPVRAVPYRRGSAPAARRREYRNAKVVLVGDSGVGKSGLALVLTGQNYRPTSSTHGRYVWTYERSGTPEETREILLWDLAGQPGYRLFHRLSLRDVAVGLVLFDAHSESDPFAGVAYWSAALDEASRGAPLVKLLVAARTDRGGPSVSRARIEEVLTRYGFAGFLETSAELGRGIEALQDEIRRRIDWKALPAISAPALFAEIQGFVAREKEEGRLLVDEQTLRSEFSVVSGHDVVDTTLFHSCLLRQEAAGLISQVRFEGQWLLQPEMLDNYAAWLAHAARDEPDGLGFLSERAAVRGEFEHTRLPGAYERVMLLAAVEEIVGQGLVLRVGTDRGEMLVFPSEVRADLPDYPGGYVRAVEFTFSGPVSAIYSTVVVRLANSVTFSRDRFYRRAALFRGPRGQRCGLEVSYARPGDDSSGRLVVFFEPDVETDIRLLFLRYVNEQLTQTALAGSVVGERVYQCSLGHPPVPPEFVALRRADRCETVICSGCGEHMPLDDLAELSSKGDDRIPDLERNAYDQQRRQQRLTVLPARMLEQRYHVFLCHNGADKPHVRCLARELAGEGILAWLDEDGMLASDQFVPTLERLMMQVPVAAIVVGPHDLSRWQAQEYYVFLQRFLDAHGDGPLRIVPVLLPGVADRNVPPFLRTFDWVDFRSGLDDRTAMRDLLAALT